MFQLQLFQPIQPLRIEDQPRSGTNLDTSQLPLCRSAASPGVRIVHGALSGKHFYGLFNPGLSCKRFARLSVGPVDPDAARTLWHLIKHRIPYDPSVWLAAEAKLKKKRLKFLQQSAAALGYTLLSNS